MLAAGRDGKALGPVSDNFLGDANFGSFYANSRYFMLINNFLSDANCGRFYANSRYFMLIFGVFTQNQNLFTLLICFYAFFGANFSVGKECDGANF